MKKLTELIWSPENQDFVYWEDKARRRVTIDRLVPIGKPIVTDINIKNLSPTSVQTHPLPDDKIVESLEQALDELRKYYRVDLDLIDAYCANKGTIGEVGEEYSTIINVYQFYRIKDRDSLQIDKW